MFGTRKLKARMAELQKENDHKASYISVHDGVESTLKRKVRNLEDEIFNHKKSLEIEHESYLEQKAIAENLDRELKKAVKFIEKEGYAVGVSEGEDICYVFGGKSTLSIKFGKENAKMNDLYVNARNEVSELLGENEDLKTEIANLKEELARCPVKRGQKVRHND